MFKPFPPTDVRIKPSGISFRPVAFLLVLFYLAATGYYFYVRFLFTIGKGRHASYTYFVVAVELLGVSALVPYACMLVRITLSNKTPGLPPAGSEPTRSAVHRASGRGQTGFVVHVLVPCYKEGMDVLSHTVNAALDAHLPSGCQRIVYLCDDGNSSEKKAWVERLRLAGRQVLYISGRERKKGEMNGKSANLNNCLRNHIYHALLDASGQLPREAFTGILLQEVVVVFDADMVCKPNFFLKVLEVMEDGRVGLCLTPQSFTNVDPAADLFNNINTQFWEYILPGADPLGYVACTGTNFCVRSQALVSAGLFPEYTLTEDYALGMELASSGWKGAYMNEYLAVGEAPEEIRNVMRQRSRWTKGHMQVFFSHRCPLFNLKLSAGNRFLFTNGTWAYLVNIIATPTFIIVPFISLVFGVHPVNITWDFALAASAYYVATLLVISYCRKPSHMQSLWFASISNQVLTFTFTKAVLSVLLAAIGAKARLAFKATDKAGPDSIAGKIQKCAACSVNMGKVTKCATCSAASKNSSLPPPPFKGGGNTGGTRSPPGPMAEGRVPPLHFSQPPSTIAEGILPPPAFLLTPPAPAVHGGFRLPPAFLCMPSGPSAEDRGPAPPFACFGSATRTSPASAAGAGALQMQSLRTPPGPVAEGSTQPPTLTFMGTAGPPVMTATNNPLAYQEEDGGAGRRRPPRDSREGTGYDAGSRMPSAPPLPRSQARSREYGPRQDGGWEDAPMLGREAQHCSTDSCPAVSGSGTGGGGSGGQGGREYRRHGGDDPVGDGTWELHSDESWDLAQAGLHSHSQSGSSERRWGADPVGNARQGRSWGGEPAALDDRSSRRGAGDSRTSGRSLATEPGLEDKTARRSGGDSGTSGEAKPGRRPTINGLDGSWNDLPVMAKSDQRVKPPDQNMKMARGRPREGAVPPLPPPPQVLRKKKDGPGCCRGFWCCLWCCCPRVCPGLKDMYTLDTHYLVLSLLISWFSAGVGIYRIAKTRSVDGYTLLPTFWALYNAIPPYLYLHYCVSRGWTFKAACVACRVLGVAFCGAALAGLWFAAPVEYDMKELVQGGVGMLEATMAGRLPFATQVAVPWRGDSALLDGKDIGADLSGGWFTDPSSNVKSSLPIAVTTALLAWAALEFPKGFGTAGQTGNVQQQLMWGANYLLNAHPYPGQFVAQVGEQRLDAAYRLTPEQMGVAGAPRRRSFLTNITTGGADSAAAASAALTAAAAALRTYSPEWSNQTLYRARELYHLASVQLPLPYCDDPSGASRTGIQCTVRKLSVISCVSGVNVTDVKARLDAVLADGKLAPATLMSGGRLVQLREVDAGADPGAGPSRRKLKQAAAAVCTYSLQVSELYPSSSISDDLAWAAAWLYRASGQKQYLEAAEAHLKQHIAQEAPLEGAKHYIPSTANMRWAAQVLLSQLAEKPEAHTTQLRPFFRAWMGAMLPDKLGRLVQMTRRGLAWTPGAPLPNVASASLLALLYSQHSRGSTTQRMLRCWAREQVRYIAGEAGRSYVAGYGSRFPKQVQARSAVCPSPMGCNLAIRWAEDRPNAHALPGALVAGPNQHEQFQDRRTSPDTVTTTDGSVPLTGAAAALLQLDVSEVVCAEGRGLYQQLFAEYEVDERVKDKLRMPDLGR